MESAKAFVSQHTSRRGHLTDVEEVVQPAVTWETVKPHRHEEITKAVDREVHQDHYHTTIQPITHREELPARHTHNLIPVEKVKYNHGNEHETKQRLAAELSQFTNIQRVEPVHHTQAAIPAVVGEHTHHHVHEIVQPILYKETIQKEYIHTVIPVHETHHAAAEHHGLSAMPIRRLESFVGAGGILDGSVQHKHMEYEGVPKAYDSKMQTTFEKLGLGSNSSSAQGNGNNVTLSRNAPITTTNTTTNTTTSTLRNSRNSGGLPQGQSLNNHTMNNGNINTHTTSNIMTSNTMKPSRRSEGADSGVGGFESRGNTAPNSPETQRFPSTHQHRNDRVSGDNYSNRSSGEYSRGSKKQGFLAKLTGRNKE